MKDQRSVATMLTVVLCCVSFGLLFISSGTGEAESKVRVQQPTATVLRTSPSSQAPEPRTIVIGDAPTLDDISTTPPRAVKTNFDKKLFIQTPTLQCDSPRRAAAPKVDITLAAITELRCPSFTMKEDNNDKGAPDRQSNWVIAKYNYYAKRCNKTNGVMWSQLTKRAHDRVLEKVLQLFGLPSAGAQNPSSSLLGRVFGGQSLAVLDWACGCGVSLDYLDRRLSNIPFVGIGVDITAGAIAYAKAAFLSDPEGLLRRQRMRHSVKFCHADGTDLHWIPPESVDAVMAFGGLLHLPSKFACSTLSRLVTILKTGHGMLWAGYIDNVETRMLLTSCRFECEEHYDVVVSVIDENHWWKGVGIPSANRKLKPVSIVWEKRWAPRVHRNATVR